MRRSETYTVPDNLYSLPPRDAYRDAFRELPLLQRIYLLLRTWFGSADITTVIKEHELAEVQRRVSEHGDSIADVTIPALLSGFHARARRVAQQISSLESALSLVRSSGAGTFMREALAQIDPELSRLIANATEVPEAELQNPSATVASVRTVILTRLEETLEIHRTAIQSHLDPVWKSIEALTVLSRVDFKGLIPAASAPDVRTPMRIVKAPLTELACAIDLCMKFRNPRAIRIAAEIAGRKLASRFPAHETIWDAIAALDSDVPMVDLVRLAADEPRLKLATISVSSGWWKRFSLAWNDAIDVGPSLLRYRSLLVEDILRNHFEVDDTAVTWIPASLYQRSLGAVRRLVASTRFRDTRTMTGALAREQSLMAAPDRARVLEAHVELDKALERLAALVGTGTERGQIGEELHRINQAGGESGVAGMQRVNVYAKHRPEIRLVLEQASGSLQTLAQLFDANRSAIRRALKSHTVRVDLSDESFPALGVLDLITESYRRLAMSISGLMVIEQELTAGKARGPVEGALVEEGGEEGEPPDAEIADAAVIDTA